MSFISSRFDDNNYESNKVEFERPQQMSRALEHVYEENKEYLDRLLKLTPQQGRIQRAAFEESRKLAIKLEKSKKRKARCKNNKNQKLYNFDELNFMQHKYFSVQKSIQISMSQYKDCCCAQEDTEEQLAQLLKVPA